MESQTLTKLADALDGVTALGFDTPPFIYFIEQHPVYVDLLRDLFSYLHSGQISGFASTITLTEVLTLPKQLQNRPLEAMYRNLLLNSRNFNLIPVDAQTADTAAELRARYRLRTPDALQLAAALVSGCQAFITNDNGLRRVTELDVYILDDLER
jgi:predicted nucleic acid-binding protein